MKTINQLTVIALICLSACRSESTSPQPGIPDALQKEETAFSYGKRYPQDLVQRLYNEKLEQSEQLKQMEDQINQLNKSKDDSTSEFSEYDDRNKDYYRAADAHLATVSDSVLRKKLHSLVQVSLEKYNRLTYTHESLLSEITSKETTIGNLHEALKILSTLPDIENYQIKQLPSPNSLQGFRNNQGRTISKLDTLVKKQGG